MPEPDRPRRLLFASPHSLLDSTSGAAISVKTLLSHVASGGHTVRALHATLFDVPKGGDALARLFAQHAGKRVLQFDHAGIRHMVVRTSQTQRMRMTSGEEEVFIQAFRAELAQNRPDAVVMFGGLLLERSMVRMARDAGIPVVFYLANGNYKGVHPFDHVSAIVTDTHATAALYKERFGLHCHVIGKFIDLTSVKAAQRRPQYIAFVNPGFEKGVSVFMALAKLALREAPAMQFLVVESRGVWAEALQVLGQSGGDFPNVRVIPHQLDMRAVYGSTRLLVMPSLWYESGGRVVVEALANGIPVLTSSNGGSSELMGDAGLSIDIPPEYRADFRKMVPESVARPWLDGIQSILADPAVYESYCRKAQSQALQHDLTANTRKFLSVVASCHAGPELAQTGDPGPARRKG